MSVTGLCNICEQREATYFCEGCGALVCDKHYNKQAGRCTGCASGQTID